MTKSIRSITLALALIGAASANAFAQGPEKSSGQLMAVSAKEAAWVAQQKASYPTDACIVSEDKLGADMGKPVDYIYRVQGQPDRLVTFCCKDCVKDFNKDPDKYLKILDEAGARKSSAHAEHKH